MVKKRPALFLTISAVLGTSFAVHHPFALEHYMLLATFLLVALLFLRNFWPSTLLFFGISFLLFAGALRYEENRYENERRVVPKDKQAMSAKVIDIWPRASGEVLALVKSGPLFINLFLKDAAAALKIEPGQKIVFQTKIRPMEKPLSPIFFDAYHYGQSHHLHGSGTINDLTSISIVDSDASILTKLRHELRTRISSHLSPHQSSLLLALILGETSLFLPEQKNIYQSIGAQHLLALSGLQITMLMGLCFFFFRLLFASILKPERAHHSYFFAAILSIILMWSFVIFCHSPRSAIRAALMSSLLLATKSQGRSMDIFDALLMSAFLALLVDPLSISDSGFLLSHAACWGLLLGTYFAKDLLLRIKEFSWLAALFFTWLIASAGAFLASFALCAIFFGTFAPSALLANFLISPLAALLQIPAILGGILGALFNAHWLLLSAGWCASIIELIAEVLSETMGGIATVSLASWQIVLFSAASFALFLSLLAQHKKAILASISLFIVPLTSLLNFKEEALKIVVMPVGQGDASLIKMPNGQSMLIDAGGSFSKDYDPGEKIVVPTLKRLGLKKLDVLVISHPDADHINGAFAVLDNFVVEEIWQSGIHHEHPLAKALLQVAKEKNIIVKDALALLGHHHFGDTRVEVLAPPTTSPTPSFKDVSTNDNSLVLRISYKDRTMLWPGDLEKEGEARLLRLHQDLKSDIVKAPHHGSKTSSSEEFILRTKPHYVVFSTGKDNRFSFPHEEVRERYKKHGAQSFTTHVDGELSIAISEKGIDIAAFVSACQKNERESCS